MKKTFLLLSIGLALLGLSSCDTRPNVIGDWQGSIKSEIPGTAMSNLTVTYSFARDGSVTTSYLINITEAAVPADSIVTPYEVSISGTALVNGKWQYVQNEDDEIAISYDMSTLNVQIDPEAITTLVNQLDEQQTAQFNDMKPAMVQKYTQLVSNYFKSSPTVVWDDVKVKKPVLRYEIGHQNFILQEVTPQ